MKEIILRNGMISFVDDEDFESINKNKWSAEFHGRGVRVYRSICKNQNRSKIYLHRIILNCRKGESVDHIDGNPLNNQKKNLRFCSHKENCYNRPSRKNSSSKFLGVSWNSSHQKWIAQMQSDNKSYYVGVYDSEKEAALAYNVAASFRFREFARLNAI